MDVSPQKIIIAGQSAGGGLAATLCQKIRDNGQQQPLAQVLYYPMLDDNTAANTALDSTTHICWNNVNNRYCWSAYLRQPPGEPSAPPYSVAARMKDLSGLPPTWLGVGDLDLFYLESLTYLERLRRAGVETDSCVSHQAPHAFDVLSPRADVSKAFKQSMIDFVQRQFKTDLQT